MKNNIKEELDKTFKELFEAVDGFDQESFNKVPSTGGWNAGQVCEHLQKSNVVSLLYGDTEAAHRDSEVKVNEIAGIFLNFDTKIKNPDFNTPEKTEHDPEEMKGALKKIHADAVKAVEDCDLSKVCSGMELPNMGKLTGIEWLYFMAYHYQRHTNQIKNILGHI